MATPPRMTKTSVHLNNPLLPVIVDERIKRKRTQTVILDLDPKKKKYDSTHHNDHETEVSNALESPESLTPYHPHLCQTCFRNIAPTNRMYCRECTGIWLATFRSLAFEY